MTDLIFTYFIRAKGVTGGGPVKPPVPPPNRRG